MTTTASHENIALMIFYDNEAAALLVFLISLLGVICNLIVAINVHRLPSMNNSFGKLTGSQAIGECVVCAVFAFFFSPMVFFEIHSMEELSRHAGWINLICYDICICSHFFIALNRLCAICIPLKYEHYFSVRHTKYMIALSWIIPMVTAVILYKLHDCDLFYSEYYWAFVFTQNEVCNYISWNVDFYKDISIVGVITVVDVITICKVHSLMAASRKAGNMQIDVRKRREFNFLRQAVLQGIVFVIELLTYFIFAWKFSNKWMIFCLTTVAWNIVHSTDAIIIIMFNKEFRALVSKPLKKVGKLLHGETIVHPMPEAFNSTTLRAAHAEHSTRN